MSIMDFFSSQGTAVPSTGSSGGDWEDWFLDMENRAPFGGRTAYPDPDAERGDWIDWYLNREGPAGRFRGSRRPKYGIDYLFNGGGSVQSRPKRNRDINSSALLAQQAGAYGGRRTPDDIRQESINWGREAGLGNRISFAGERGRDILNPNEMRVNAPSVEGWKQRAQRKMWMDRMYQGEDNPYYDQDQDWDNTGIMAAMTDTSPDFRGNWLFNNKFGNMFGKFMLGRHGDKISPEDKEILGEAFGQDGGISVFGGKLRPIIGDDGYGFNWKIGTDLLGLGG